MPIRLDIDYSSILLYNSSKVGARSTKKAVLVHFHAAFQLDYLGSDRIGKERRNRKSNRRRSLFNKT